MLVSRGRDRRTFYYELERIYWVIVRSNFDFLVFELSRKKSILDLEMFFVSVWRFRCFGSSFTYSFF